jgi:DNA replication protein DnaC
MAAFDWAFQPKLDRRAVEELFTLGWVEPKEDILLTGKSGTGKSHILQALVLKACEQEWTGPLCPLRRPRRRPVRGAGRWLL